MVYRHSHWSFKLYELKDSPGYLPALLCKPSLHYFGMLTEIPTINTIAIS